MNDEEAKGCCGCLMVLFWFIGSIPVAFWWTNRTLNFWLPKIGEDWSAPLWLDYFITVTGVGFLINITSEFIRLGL